MSMIPMEPVVRWVVLSAYFLIILVLTVLLFNMTRRYVYYER